mmetsp:Transcript_21291/g.30141  ORF Transcript_21291/g.30141 Transcript_21291/m.30141 type:complete len:193 (+) Transcript_21291:91-669(+)
MATPTPDNVKEILKQLTAAQQVTIRAYIASLKEEVKGLETKIRQLEDGDAHAHFHGHEKCTADHSHDLEHKEEEKEGDGHEHHHGHESCTEDHSHGHEHQEEQAKGHEHKHEHGHGHGHEHKETKKEEESSHNHDHGHKHGHDHEMEDKAEDTIPAWKKKALEQGATDPMAAPFGGSWNVESSLSATDKMEE